MTCKNHGKPGFDPHGTPSKRNLDETIHIYIKLVQSYTKSTTILYTCKMHKARNSWYRYVIAPISRFCYDLPTHDFFSEGLANHPVACCHTDHRCISSHRSCRIPLTAIFLGQACCKKAHEPTNKCNSPASGLTTASFSYSLGQSVNPGWFSCRSCNFCTGFVQVHVWSNISLSAFTGFMSVLTQFIWIGLM